MKKLDDFALQTQLDHLEQLIRDNQSSIRRSDLAEEFAIVTGERLSDRTMMRRLGELLRQGRILTEGTGPGKKYRSASARPASPKETVNPAVPRTNTEDELVYIPLTQEAEKIKVLVNRPLNSRPITHHESRFLESYRPNETWYLTAEQRKQLHTWGHTPEEDQPAGTYAKQIYEQLLIDLSWASSHLEGNKYTKLDTRELIEFGRVAEDADETETQMILNHKAAIEMMVQSADEIGFNRYTFLGLHGLLSENLLTNKEDEGRLRVRPIRIGRSTYSPTAVPQKVEEHFDLILEKAAQISDPFEQAFFVLVHIPYLQPFIDANKRTSRIGANLSLIKANLSPISFIDLPPAVYVDGLLGVYELRQVELLREAFVWAYERSAAQYATFKESVPKPDPIRLKYRDQLRAVVLDQVQKGIYSGQRGLTSWARKNSIPPGDTEAFVNAARAEFLDLHEGSLGKFGLRPSEFAKWKSRARALEEKRARRLPT